jgi:hypothetical protein
MLRRILPHVCIVLSLMLLTLVILDKYNPGMNFIGNSFFKVMLVILCIAALIEAGILIAQDRRSK